MLIGKLLNWVNSSLRILYGRDICNFLRPYLRQINLMLLLKLF
jgi:hypothetical protein